MPSPGAQKKYINKKTTRSSTHTLTSTLKIRHTRYNTNPKTQYYAGLQGFKGLSIMFWLFDKVLPYLKGLI